MYFLGSTDHRGTYYWYSQQHQGWITADLDLEKAQLHDGLATVKVERYTDAYEALLGKWGIGQDEEKWLVDSEDLLQLLRDYAEDVQVLMVYYLDGSQKPYGKTERAMAAALSRAKKAASKRKNK